jgi:hypothetical protein
MTVRDDRGDVKQTTTGFRDPRHHICQKHIPIPLIFGSAMQINIQDDFEPDFYQFIVAVPNWLNLHPEADRASDLP